MSDISEQKEAQVEEWIDQGIDPDLAAKAVEGEAPQPDPVEEVAAADVTDVAEAKVAPVAEEYAGETDNEGNPVDDGSFEDHLAVDQARRQAESAAADAAELLEPFEAAFLGADAEVKRLSDDA